MKKMVLALSVIFMFSCQKGHEGFPNYGETEKFASKFVFYNRGDDSVSNVKILNEVYFPLTNSYEGISVDSSTKKWNKYDSIVYSTDDLIYKTCKANMTIELSYYYSAADSIPKTKKTSTYLIPYQVLDQKKNGLKFNWPNDTVYFTKK